MVGIQGGTNGSHGTGPIIQWRGTQNWTQWTANNAQMTHKPQGAPTTDGGFRNNQISGRSVGSTHNAIVEMVVFTIAVHSAPII